VNMLGQSRLIMMMIILIMRNVRIRVHPKLG
jgi:hypothetical protein